MMVVRKEARQSVTSYWRRERWGGGGVGGKEYVGRKTESIILMSRTGMQKFKISEERRGYVANTNQTVL